MMKRITALTLSLFLALSLSACKNNPAPSAPNVNTQQASAPATETAPAEETAPPIEPSPSPSPSPMLYVSGAPATLAPIPPFEETVLVDKDNIKITATALENVRSSILLSLLIENNSNKRLTFYVSDSGYAAVNGYMCAGHLYSTVDAGKKSYESVSFDSSELSLLGITSVADIELVFIAKDENYDLYFQSDPCYIKTPLAETYDYSTDTYLDAVRNPAVLQEIDCSLSCFDQNKVFDQSGLQVISHALLQPASGHHILFAEVVNNSSASLVVTFSEISINGLTVCSGTWNSNHIAPGKHSVIGLDLSSMLDAPYWDALGISGIYIVEYTFGARYLGGSDAVLPQSISISTGPQEGSLDTSGTVVYDQGGIKIISKGLAPDEYSSSDDIHALFLVTNNGSQQFMADVDYNSVSVNGFMTNFSCYGAMLSPGKTCVLDVELRSSSFEKNGITDMSDITDIELTFEFTDTHYWKSVTPKVSVNYQ